MTPRRILQLLEQISLDVEVDQSAVTVIATKSTDDCQSPEAKQ